MLKKKKGSEAGVLRVSTEKNLYQCLNLKIKSDLFVSSTEGVTLFEAKAGGSKAEDLYQLRMYHDGCIADDMEVREAVHIAQRHPDTVKALLAELNCQKDKKGCPYRGVPLRDLTGQGEGTLSYLLCRGEEAVAAFLMGDAGNLSITPGLPTLRFQGDEPKKAVSVMKPLLLKDISCRWRYAPEPVPDFRLPELERNRLVLWNTEGLVLGGYGRKMGLILGYCGTNSSPTPRIFWSVETRKAIEALLENRGSPQPPCPRACLSWAERLAAAQTGFIAPGCIQEAVRALANLPLETLLSACLEHLEYLRCRLLLPVTDTYR